MKATIKLPNTRRDETLSFDEIKSSEGVYSPISGGSGNSERLLVVGYRRGDEVKETVVLFLGESGDLETANQEHWSCDDCRFVRTGETVSITIK